MLKWPRSSSGCRLHHYVGSYSSVWRFVSAALELRGRTWSCASRSSPAKRAQVDFGCAGRCGSADQQSADGMGLRHDAVLQPAPVRRIRLRPKEPDLALLCHRHAFEYFAGVPERAVVDNLRLPSCAAWDDPEIQRSYRECAEHYAHRPVPTWHPRAQGQGRTGRRALRQAQLSGRPSAHRSRMPTRPCCSGVSRWPGSASTAPSSRNRCCVSAKSSRRPCSRCRRRPTSQAPGSTSSCTVTAMSSSSRLFYSAPYALVGQSLWRRQGHR